MTTATREASGRTEDDQLVEAVRAGDDAAFSELYLRYQPRIAAYVRGMVRDSGAAEDIAQEAFMSALRRMRATTAPIAFRPWIFEIARNASIDLHRRGSRAQEVSMDADNGLRPADHLRLVHAAAPEHAVIAKERLDHLQGAFDELSQTHHQILVMRELEGLSYKQIGQRTGLTRPAVESALFRARRRLEQEYDDIDSGARCDAMGGAIARLAEGIDSPRDRRRLGRHMRRCAPCRRQAAEMNVRLD
nr:sigma-70 family RNA polymerase sigma factor [Thermoleophilaceae bacterium]